MAAFLNAPVAFLYLLATSRGAARFATLAGIPPVSGTLFAHSLDRSDLREGRSPDLPGVAPAREHLQPIALHLRPVAVGTERGRIRPVA